MSKRKGSFQDFIQNIGKTARTFGKRFVTGNPYIEIALIRLQIKTLQISDSTSGNEESIEAETSAKSSKPSQQSTKGKRPLQEKFQALINNFDSLQLKWRKRNTQGNYANCIMKIFVRNLNVIPNNV